MKYDDASWHYEGEFPAELSEYQAGVHIGFFLGWAVDSGLEGELLKDQFAAELSRFRNREISAAELIHTCSDGKLTDDDLNAEGNSFAEVYYEDYYYGDYEEAVGSGYPTLYHVEDTWDNYALVRQMLDGRFAEWRGAGGGAGGGRGRAEPPSGQGD